MTAYYELWNTASGNRIDGFTSLGAMLNIVREIAYLGGDVAVENLMADVRFRKEDDEPFDWIEGDDLLDRIKVR